MVSVDYRDSRPIYEQIKDSLRQQIFAGVLRPGDKLASVRDLAKELAINPNTIQRAYRDLEAEGCIVSVRGKGSFVADASSASAARRAELEEQLVQAANELRALGCSIQDLIDLVEGGCR